MPAAESTRASSKWSSRLMPPGLLAIIVLATYLTIYLTVEYLIRTRNDTGAAVGFLVPYFLFLILATVAWIRTYIAVRYNVGFVPLRSDLTTNDAEKGSTRPQSEDAPKLPDADPNSPGLEEFYSREVFECEYDGRPKWCHECKQWKPDRAHHSGEMGRCIMKMDHYCPWVGGMVSENSFKYFTQFTIYLSLFVVMCFSLGVYCLVLQRRTGGQEEWRSIVLLSLSAFFSTLSGAMAITSIRLISQNQTNVDMLQHKNVHHLAVRIPLGSPPTEQYSTITYPLPSTPTSQGRQPNGTTVPFEPPVLSERDRLAMRTFAILRTEPKENPWNLGFKKNWQSVMGNRFTDWFLPIKPSPCTQHDDMYSLYPFGPVLEKMKQRYGLESSSSGLETKPAMTNEKVNGQ